jgi:hypothetical protein
LGLAAVAAASAWKGGMPVENLSAVVGFVILAIGVYDLTREFLERLRTRKEGELRRQLRHLESDSSGEEALKSRLQEGLDLLCHTLHAPGGLIAVRRGEEFVVMATRRSVPVESRIAAELVSCEDVSQPADLPDLAWIAPSFEGKTQIAVIGIGKARSRLDYSSGDLDLLAEVADQVGVIVSLSNRQPRQDEKMRLMTAESQAGAFDLNSATGGLMDAIMTNPDADFIKSVEDGLRHLPDTIVLGQSRLAEKLGLGGETHVERGKQLQQILIESIESLRPAGKRPPEPLPRIWYNHAVLHDAYVEGVQNREIMARLYISEGTFNRTRRNAIRGLARLLVEKVKR